MGLKSQALPAEKRQQPAAIPRLPSACTAAPSSTCPRSVHLFACLIVRDGHTVQLTGKQEASCLQHSMKNKPRCQPWVQLNYCEYDLPARADEDKPALVPFQKTCLGEPRGMLGRDKHLSQSKFWCVTVPTLNYTHTAVLRNAEMHVPTSETFCMSCWILST